MPQVRTILEGVTHGGSRLNDKNDILNQKQSLERLITMVRTGKFDLHKSSFCSLHEIAAKEEALSWGVFRTGRVSVAGTNFAPPSHEELDKIFTAGIAHIKSIQHPLERAIVFFLFGTLHQFFYDANKRTSRLMMNGILLASGMDALVIDASKRYQYNMAMLDLYNKRNGDTAIQFLLDCYRNQG